ncbi:MAG: glycosyltransferase family 39 protein [Bryobacteraceae bacterium]
MSSVQARENQTLSRVGRAAPAFILVLYALLLGYGYDRTPPGLNNDAAEEALRAIYLLDQHRFQPMAVGVIGTSTETFYTYLVALLARLTGPSTLAIHFVSWVFALACLWVVWRLAKRIAPDIPVWAPLLLLGGSAWFLHYARSGLRAIAAPLSLAAFTLLLDRAESSPRDRWKALGAGLVLGLSLYTYTSTRILPLAFLAYAVFRLIRRRALAPCYAAIAAGAFVASIPNLIFFARQPGEFLARGSYVVKGGWTDIVQHAVSTMLAPFYYPDYYRNLGGPTYYFDGVSAALAAMGNHPVNLVLAAALLVGVLRMRQEWDRPVVAYLAACWITAMATLGISGPSLTRTLIVLPVYVVLASLGVSFLLRRFPRARLAVLSVLVLAALYEVGGYMTGFSQSRAAQFFYSPAATPLGQAAAGEAKAGRRVLCVLSKDANVVRFLTHGEAQRVRIAEFYRRPVDPAEVRAEEFKPQVLLVENALLPAVAPLLAEPGTMERREQYTSIHVRR